YAAHARDFACCVVCFFFRAEDGIRVSSVTGVQTCALPISIAATGTSVRSGTTVRSICRAVVPDRTLVPVAAMALVGLCFPLVFWTLRGMEVGLTALLLAMAARLALGLRDEVTGRPLIALGGVLAAAGMTRHQLVVPA